MALQESLRLGSVAGALEVLGAMDARTAAECLREAGFAVSEDAIGLGQGAIMAEIQADFDAALAARVDGYGLARQSQGLRVPTAAEKTITDESQLGDFAAATRLIQRIMRAEQVEVRLFGDANASERSSLQFVAGQALQKRVQGFAFEGISGKYDVPIPLPAMVELHKEAARAVAGESARMALGVWATGGKIGQINEWVPDSVQKLLSGSVSLEAAASLVESIKGGTVGRNASAYGAHGFATLLAEQGFDVNAKTVAMQAADLGLDIVDPDRQRGQYVGSVVGMDHRAGLVKFNRKSAIELPFAALAEDQERPMVGDRVRMGFKNGALTVSVAPVVERGGLDR
ncbi:MAG TPA: hypothetical protein VJ654_12780 [Noviherbaspirillum sp.]|nr:hypothetical protein [Noviherbaspirillum sp.]